jgi:hypothetical protein
MGFLEWGPWNHPTQIIAQTNHLGLMAGLVFDSQLSEGAYLVAGQARPSPSQRLGCILHALRVEVADAHCLCEPLLHAVSKPLEVCVVAERVERKTGPAGA